MWPFLDQLKLIRYLFIWKINSPLVRLADRSPLEISSVLGTLISRRLPTRQAGAWQKALAPLSVTLAENSGKNRPRLQANLKKLPETLWPLESVLFMYPNKLTLGQGEVIMWELKLFGKSADHGFFLETILPAMEEASCSLDTSWDRRHGLFGHFDIQAVYVASGSRWEPLVKDGRLDLRCKVSPIQWKENLTFGQTISTPCRTLTWLTPFTLGDIPLSSEGFGFQESKINRTTSPFVLTLRGLLEMLLFRLQQLLPANKKADDEVFGFGNPSEQTVLQGVLEEGGRVPIIFADLKPCPRYWPGTLIGKQIFEAIPPSIIPLLELASIIHIGRKTHLGSGTFFLSS